MSAPAPIAIVGIACRYPDAVDAGELWETVLGRRRAFRQLPDQRLGAGYRGTDPDRTYLSHAAVLRGWEFDRHRFGVPGRLYRAVDLTHWLALQTCAEALSDAGFPDGAGLDRDRVGVLFGNSLTGEFSRAAQLRLRWPFTRRAAAAALAASGVAADQAAQTLEVMENLVRGAFPEPGDESLAGALSNTIAGRICNQFDFHGTGYTVDGACASSLLAVMTACRALGSGELDFALAGGVDLSLDPFELVGFARMNALAEGREMRVYDAEPTGFLPGEGCGVVALMRAEDARRAGLREYAVLAGWGTSSDGSGGLTRPEESGQARALRRAYTLAGIDPAAVDLIEGHGTGTAVGDRVELATLNQVRAGARRAAALGSVKANIGHTKAAAGAAGLIKAALAVHHRVLPPTTGCREPHELLTSAGSTVRVLAEPEPWPGTTPVAAVSSMGFGGINSHVVLTGTSGPQRAFVPEPLVRWSRPLPQHEIVLLTAYHREELVERLTALSGRAASMSSAELHDLAATKYETAQQNAAVRCALVADSPERLAAVAAKAASRARTWTDRLVLDRDAGFVLAERGGYRIGLVFPGQAAPVRARLEGWAEGLGVPALPEGVYVRDGVTGTAVAQPAIVRQSLAALAWLTDFGCRPVAAAGHSLGEITALVWAGALSGEDALRLAADRGRIMARHGRQGTTMASVGLPADRVGELLLGTSVTVAGINATDQTAIAGTEEEVRQVVGRAVRAGVRAMILPVSHGFHSPAMAEAVTPLAARLREIEFGTPLRPVVSTVTGRPLDRDTDLAALLAEQVTAPVRFTDALGELGARCDLLVEVGPGTTLSSLVSGLPVVSVDSGGSGRGHALTAAVLATTSAGDLGRWFGDRAHRRFDEDTPITLLANPCELDVVAEQSTEDASAAPAEELEGDPVGVLRGHLARVLELPVDGIRPDSRLLGDLHLNSLQITQIIVEVAAALGRQTPVLPASAGEATVAETAELLASQPLADRAGRGTAGVRTWTRAFEHRWRPWVVPAATTAVRWSAHSPAGHWTHELAEKSTADSAARRGLVLWLDDEAGPPEIADALRAIAVHRPDVLCVLHHGHPAAAAIARSAGVELESCVASSVELPPDNRDFDLGGAAHGEQLRIGPAGEVEHLTTTVRAAGTGTVPLRPGDVCLVTGGVTGITARCAEALAERAGCTLVVLGRSPADTPRITEGLARLGVAARYVQCDVTDPAQVRRAVAVARGHGPVRGLLHGAGVNVPRLLGEVTADTLTATMEPKVVGLRRLLDEVGGELTLAIGFGSIIGRRGLAGQSEYCVANELLRAEFETWARSNPSCRTRVLEWSVWSDIGMGERMGVLDSLRGRGIVPIEPEAGVRALLSAVTDDDAPVTLLVSGRFPAGPTLTVDGPAHEPLRFTSDVLVRVPGVETVVEPSLSLGSDLYLDDHRVDGVPVLPAVAGLEAMAQAAAATVGDQDGWEFTGIDLVTPVVFDEHESRPVRIAALAREHPADGVDVVLRDQSDGFAADRFLATVRPAGPPPADRPPLPVAPADGPHPYYGPLLFHSGRMRRLTGYDHLSAFRVRAWVRADEHSWFSDFHGSKLLLGDIGAQDAAIHVLLACLPHRKALPVHAERMTVWRKPTGMLLVSAEERAHDGNEYIYEVSVTDEHGAVVVEWEGLRLRAVGPRDWPVPLPPSLVGPLLSRRLIECGLAGPLELVSSAEGITAGAADVVGLAWENGGAAAPEPDRLAEAIAQKVDEPAEIAARRVACARRALSDLGTAGQPLTIEEVTEDGLVVLGAGAARVTTFAGSLIVAVALPEGR